MFKYKYEEMLDRAFEKMPQKTEEEGRFDFPSVKGFIQGNRTIVSNIQQIAKQLGRDPAHVLKFLLRELATTYEEQDAQIQFIGKFGSDILNKKLEKYIKEFVLCNQCGKPDTNLLKEKGVTFKRCEACGARSTVRSLK